MLKYIVSFMLIFLSMATWGQDKTAIRMKAALDSFSFYRPQEKAYLFTDREEYIAGETIWFKTWVSLNGLPTPLSKVVYVELADAKGVLIEKNMLLLDQSAAHGNISLRNDLPAGNYVLRCYTLWMLNFPDFIPEKKIRVWNTGVRDQKTANANTADPSIQFFPESGSLVAGLKSRVAFKAIDAEGRPLSVAGEILNSKNEKIISFSTLQGGMGSFEIQPASNEKYRALVQFPGGMQKTIDMPAFAEEGIVLSADNSNPGKTFIKVERGEKNKEKYNELVVVAQLNYQLAYLGKLNIDEGMDAAAISKKGLPPGIMVITVLSFDGRPLAERIVFIANHSGANELLEAKHINIKKREKNSIELDASGFNGLNAAVSVINANGGAASQSSSILSDLLLSSDIHGNIADPGYYFKDKEPATLEALDLVMLTHGWRRYRTGDILAGNYPDLHYPFETSLHVSGKVLQSNGRTPLQSGRINLIIKGEDSTTILAEAKTDQNGRFVVNDIRYKKLATMFYQGTNAGKTEALVSVKIDSAYFDTLKRVNLVGPVYSALPPADAFINQGLDRKSVSDTGRGKLLAGVTVKGRKRSEADSLNQVYATDIFYNSDQTLALNHNINYNDIWQYLRMMVPGIAINQTDTGMQVNFTRYTGLDFFSENTTTSSVQFFLNEVAVNISTIDILDPSDVAMVKIFKGATGIALGADRGAIALYTEKGKTGRDWRQRGFDFFRRYGYSDTREFYAMDYGKINPASAIPDNRPTLFWNPNLKIENGKALIEFYNDDACTAFKLIVEGMDKDGKLLRAEGEWK